MSRISLFFLFFLFLSNSLPGQTDFSRKRQQEIEKEMSGIYSAKEFREVAGRFQMNLKELSRYPVLFPVKRVCYESYASSGFGRRKHPVYKVVKNHTGIDIAERKGSPVYATGNGVVIATGYGNGYGRFVEILHAGGFSSFYAHLDTVLVEKGMNVLMGQKIGAVGCSGIATGNHLHYEVRKNGRYLEPEAWCYCLLDWMEEQMMRSRGKSAKAQGKK